MESIERMPEIGMIGMMLANRITSMMPVQNTGAAKPTMLSTVMNCESRPFGLREDSTPSVVPITNASSTELTTSSSVAGTCATIIDSTGTLKKYE